MLTIAVSSRALFDMEQEHQVFLDGDAEAFDRHQVENEDEPLLPGVAFQLVRKLLALNTPGKRRDKVEVVLLSRNSPNAGMRIIKSINHYGMDIERAIFTQGTDRFKYSRALGVHLFLSANSADVISALNNGVASAVMMPKSVRAPGGDDDVRIAFDGDAVIFSDEAERVNVTEGLNRFTESEQALARTPLGPGPFKGFLQALHELQAQYPVGECPVKISLVTARSVQAQERVIRTLRHWGIALNEACFCGGLPKGPFLDAFGADIFFDDAPRNCESAAQHVATGLVPSGVNHEAGVVHA
ncbi:5'-nucleotidase [Paraburkholderia sp. UCT31]|uniref:5'-nucleotidase n=1 Tax=Paraburkholderia sp. UCT31 TaxID=2615209 RepID=UPI0016554C57|nr:5'-nucleotidase [Paraburkholderia sp. UCT31]MBC8737297.1 5'-nucleotidase [Paraburkholderia sp. UCT31]